MASTPQFIGTYRSSQTQLVAAHATRPRPVWTPGSNGSRIHSINVATDDSTSGQTLTLYRATPLTLASNMGTANLVKGTPDTITRTAGSFLTDGWIQNQRIFVLGSTTLANDVTTFLSAAVAALTLTITASTFNNSEAFPSTGKLMMASLIATISLPASSGSGTSTVPLNALNPNLMPTLLGAPDNFFMLGSADMLLAAVSTSVASNKSVDIVVEGGDY
ncbi:MAG TPA: hypothetical protein VGO93_26385 [Candidatus Xenobia bacterium]|jgi:hypothetical protein